MLFKREDLQPVFSFKIRGAYNKIAQLTDLEAARGVICASAGNHAQGVALAASRRGIRAVICMPWTTPAIKVEAVQAMAAALGLGERVQLRCERIERTGQQQACRGQFDWALARAVASAPVVAEYLVPLLQPQGRALLYRGQWSADDQRDLNAALIPLKAGIDQCLARELPSGRGSRHALVVKPLAPCPRTYPRAVGLPAKQPLGAATCA